jgi:toxin-antitoxin system PIN domain toxin
MTISDAPALMDANILVYGDQAHDEHHEAAKAIRDLGQRGELSLCVTPQVLNEYSAVVTNPRRVTHPLPPAEAMAQVEKYVRSRHIRKLYPGPGVHDRLRELFERRSVAGADIFDLYLVATMLENGIRRIYTFNTDDFAPFSQIEVLTPPEPEPTPSLSPVP